MRSPHTLKDHLRRAIALAAAGYMTAWIGAARAVEAPTIANSPPVVIKTEPTAGASDVPASTSEIRVTFSKKMRDKDWSWSMVSQESFPKMTGNPRFSTDMTTCTLPVTLEPGKIYAIWINNPPAQNFQDSDGRKAVPYLLVFSTK